MQDKSLLIAARWNGKRWESIIPAEGQEEDAPLRVTGSSILRLGQKIEQLQSKEGNADGQA